MCVHIMLLMAILLRTVLVFLDFATERGLSGFSLLCSPYYSFPATRASLTDAQQTKLGRQMQIRSVMTR